MRLTLNKSLLLLAALAVLGLAACDTAGEHPVDWEIGDELAIVLDALSLAEGDLPNDGFAPGTAYMYVQAHNRAWDYTWSVSPEVPSEVLREEEFFRIEFDDPGTYTVTVSTTIEGEAYDGALEVVIEAPTAAGQVGRLPQFSALATALGVSGISIPDSSVTILAPNNEAFTAAFGDELPADSVLTGILETHVIAQTLTAEDITAGATFETVGGGEVTFQGSGDALTVVVMNDMGEIIAEVPATLTGLAVANGTVIELDGVLTPTSALVDFLDQTAVDSVTVASVYLAQGGFVAIHDSTLLGPDGEPFTADDQPVTSVIGVSEKLEAGVHSNVQVALFEGVLGASFTQDSLQVDQTLFAMPHRDNPEDGSYTFVETGGATDGPYTEDGNAVVDPAAITVAEE